MGCQKTELPVPSPCESGEEWKKNDQMDLAEHNKTSSVWLS